MSTEDKSIEKLLSTLPQKGKVEWIGVRTKRKGEVKVVGSVFAEAGKGLEGDRSFNLNSENRQATLIQAEHVEALASLLNSGRVDPKLLRRNIVVSGINLMALKGRQFKIGKAVFETTGECHPCSRMEENLGDGGYNAMRGHGGITARIIESGEIKIGDPVFVHKNLELI